MSKTINDLSVVSPISGSDEIVVYDVDDTTGIPTKKMTIADLRDWLGQNGLQVASVVINDQKSNLWSIESRSNTPPPSPLQNQCFFVEAGATGGWAGNDGKVACFDGSAWVFSDVNDGDVFYNKQDNSVSVVTNAPYVWQEITNQTVSPSSLQNLPGVGINSSYTSGEKLRVKSDKVVFDNDSADFELQLSRTQQSFSVFVSLANNYDPFFKLYADQNSDDVKFSVSQDNGATWSDVFAIRNSDGHIVAPTIDFETDNYHINGGASAFLRVSRSGASNLSTAVFDDRTSGAGFRVASSSAIAFRLDRTSDGNTWNRILHVRYDGTWETNQVRWKTTKITVGPDSGNFDLVLVSNGATAKSTLKLENQNTNYSSGFSLDNNKLVFSGGNPSSEIYHYNFDDEEFVSTKFVFNSPLVSIHNNSPSITITDDGSGVSFSISPSSTGTKFNYGSNVLWEVDNSNGNLKTPRVVVSDVNPEFVLSGQTNKLMAKSDQNTVGLYYDNSGSWVRIFDYTTATNKFGFQQFDAEVSGAYSVSVQSTSASFSVDNGNGDYDIKANTTVDGDLSVKGSFVTENLTADRTQNTENALVYWKTAGYPSFSMGLLANSNNITFRRTNDGGVSWQEIFTVNRATGKITAYGEFFATGIVNSLESFRSSKPVGLKAKDDSTRSFGTNVTELLQWPTVVFSEGVSITTSNEIEFSLDGVYTVLVKITTSSATASDGDEWNLKISDQNNNILNETGFDVMYPNTSSSTGTIERWFFSNTININSGDKIKIEIDGINSNADVTFSSVEIARGI